MCLGVPARVVEIADPARKLGTVDRKGERMTVNLACIWPESGDGAGLLGAWVNVHLGFAMQRMSEDEAREADRILEEIAEIMGARP